MKASKIRTTDFFDDLTSRYARRRFFWGFLIIIIFCLILVSILKDWNGLTTTDIIISILIEVVSGSLIILGFYALYVYFIGPNVGFREVSVLRPQDISGKMKVLPLNVTTYMFWGRSGSFFRSYPISILDKQASDRKHNVTIDVLLPDPEESRLVDSYRDILTSLGENEGENALLSHVIATCITCAIVDANNRFINVRVYLSRFLPGFRLDLSDNGAILTQDDKKKVHYFLNTDPNSTKCFAAQ